MRIATFNLENFGDDTFAPEKLEQRISILRPQLKRLRADVLCLQEVNGQKTPAAPDRSLIALEALLEDTDYAHYNKISTKALKGSGVKDVHNLVVLTRFAILESCEVKHNLVAPPHYHKATADPPRTSAEEINWDRSFLACTLDLPSNNQLHIVNLHLRAPLAAPITGQKISPFVWRSVSGWAEGYFIAAIKRLGQALEVRMHIEKLFDREPQCLIAVCGDFNAEDHEMPMNIITGAEEDTGNSELAGRALAQVDRSISADRRFSVLHHSRAQMLDHILSSRTLFGSLQQVEIHNEMLEDETVAQERASNPLGSYHAPLVAEFTVEAAGH